MDILKLLSRGTRGQAGAARGNALRVAADLPSAGAHTNPQLFHDPIRSTDNDKSRKRKRGSSSKAAKGGDGECEEILPADEGDDDASDVSELDFFANRDSAKTTEATPVKKAKSNGDDKSSKKTNEKRSENIDKTVGLLDEDECRQILRSHRLKLSLLSDKKTEKAEKKKEKDKKKKSSKKSKKEAEEESKGTKDDKKPVLPQPLTAFSQLRHTYGISPRLADNLDRLLYRIPTEVQMGSLPLLLDPTLALSKTELSGDEGNRQRDGLSANGGVDFMAVAPTGSGKTLSFLVPSISSVLKRRAEEKAELEDPEAATVTAPKRKHDYGLHTVVVAPTRELARQIANEGKKLAVGTGVRVVAMRKGMRVQAASAEGEEGESGNPDDEESSADSDDDEDEDEEEEEEDGPEEGQDAKGGKGTKTKKAAVAATVTRADILVTTPLMLLNSLSGGSAKQKKTLPTVRTLVLDEADVLLDPLFREQTLGLWGACTHPQLQATFWSATMASNVEELVAKQLGSAAEKGETAAAGKKGMTINKSRLLVRLVVGLKDTAVPNVTHRLVYTATEQGKLLAMRQLLHPTTSVSVTGQGQKSSGAATAETPLRPPFLVFAQTAERATALHDELKYDIPAAAGGADRLGVLHAALADGARAAVVRRFRAGEVWVLITTDVLARGIDFAGVNGVVNYDVPGSAAAYVHRAGRTGRAGRQGGLAVTLYTKEDIPFVKSVANVIAASEKQAGKGPGTEAASSNSSNSTSNNAPAAVPQWLLDALPNVTKADKKRLKTRGMESRRTGGSSSHGTGKNGGSSKNGNGKGNAAGRSRITSKSAWERRKENNLRDAIASSKRRKLEAEKQAHNDDEWTGLD
ncbi:ATP dependent RNA helicase [Grosmannia clavigera kw1407]|uniref:ATP-dependent RNA helicase ROK1 n=1 Tax=Grosmannia clavigera (strain kw1407 / UAMH 11150) TaxID=655863 RepID=F0XU53_GROCL|nr:ATP dependent RNA helicase [Grosmannia clavigera kw1407]EFW98803.1 ATP dependent RNA helicase [Grosmannia clavigera kw1407]